MTIGGHVRGTCSIGASLAPLDLAPGTIFFIPPNTPFEAQVESSAEIINVYISEQLFKNIEKEFLRVSENLLSLSFRFSVSDSFLSQTMLSIKEIVERGGTFARIELEYFVRVLTARLIVKYSKRCPAEHVGESGLPPMFCIKRLLI
ncbi:AraC family ligand binding domain-containing protein [Brucella sp. JSBI001]|uniref:AraC family ligand binding domain-containing protein n=1 Tax=Brucella sp. JSBI001 TaxID=2886044 RepID=UPI00222EAFC1|nr:AraC family ligand binding domain-containing protein [Brucella sp. JSBI001]UZD72131.1 AraC family ligand binding domain-containing protein [Brucella sp. JSBI001]